ncbi:hypothetical protein P8844_06345 [Bacillus spizizenii]|nr:hypothetical protein [Bacillus spizizenii]MCY8052158.1 hypothetical protein [Bacillus spizizenii]MCY8646922.1 hypothetical protein [Bacillus spizizenii]MCY8805752.1 hypothetical protein [Bacillus spizizenii]MCY9367700.1 hypothetical protein [Bacillus spizizenii]
MNKIDELKEFLKENIHNMVIDGGVGSSLPCPDFDLLPRDFLKFAKNELDNLNKNKDNLIHIINCLSHLKRALDCQLDTFFYQINLFNLIKKRNLSFDQKVFFLKNARVIDSSSISRLNYIRNKMEHHYIIPKIEEIEVYFDLVNAFILVLESSTAFFSIHHTITISLENEGSYNYFSFSYVFDEHPKIVFEANYLDFKITVDPSEKNEFVYFLRAFILLGKLDYMQKEHMLEELDYEIVWPSRNY